MTANRDRCTLRAMVINLNEVTAESSECVRGGVGTAHAHKLLDLYPSSALKSVGVVRLEPGASIGKHSHSGDEDFYFCISGTGMVVDNGREIPFTPGTLQITRSGETQELINTGKSELVFLGALIETK